MPGQRVQTPLDGGEEQAMTTTLKDRMRTRLWTVLVTRPELLKPHPRALPKRVRDDTFYDRRWAERLVAVAAK